MAGLHYRHQTFELGEFTIRLRALKNLQQFEDDTGEANDLGISSALWPMFGVVWPSGEALAALMSSYPVTGRRILEVGCGIGLASLLLNARDADISATDIHPRAQEFLDYNTSLNDDQAIPFFRTGWEDGQDESYGRFDLIIGSDLLYEQEPAEQLPRFIQHYGKPDCEVIVVDARRGLSGKFIKRMEALGFTAKDLDCADWPGLPAEFKGRILGFKRGNSLK